MSENTDVPKKRSIRYHGSFHETILIFYDLFETYATLTIN